MPRFYFYANIWSHNFKLVVVFFTTTFKGIICMYMQKLKTIPHIFFHQLLFLITVSLMEAVAFSKDLTIYLAPQCQAFIGALNEPPHGKTTICIGENKGADQLRGNREADQRLCFRYSDSTIPPLLNSKISSF